MRGRPLGFENRFFPLFRMFFLFILCSETLPPWSIRSREFQSVLMPDHGPTFQRSYPSGKPAGIFFVFQCCFPGAPPFPLRVQARPLLVGASAVSSSLESFFFFFREFCLVYLSFPGVVIKKLFLSATGASPFPPFLLAVSLPSPDWPVRCLGFFSVRPL